MVLKIVVLKDDKPIDQYVVGSDKTTIGRRSECDISIKDPAISGNHAEIQQIKGKFVIQDLGSTNGVHMAGRKITQHVLKDGDLLSVGEHHMRIMLTAGEVGDKARDLKAARDQQAAKQEREAKRAVAPPPEKTQLRGDDGDGCLVILNGDKAGQRITLTQALTTVGEPGIQVAAVSKRPQGHFIIHVDGGKDKDRVPLVNGEPTGFKSRKLEPGDKIEVAGIQMAYET
jgi:hypothetical protein